MMKMIKVKKAVAAKITGALLLASTVLAGIMPVPVFAQSKEAVCICEEKCTDESINEECEVCSYDHNFCESEEAEPVEENYGPLTPDGNMNLVDDYGSLVESSLSQSQRSPETISTLLSTGMIKGQKLSIS